MDTTSDPIERGRRTVARATSLLPEFAARAAEIESLRRIPAELAGRLARAGLFRMLVPAALGGLELRPHEALAAIESVARADASAAWCVMVSSTTGLAGAYLEPEVARRIFSTPETIACGVFAPMGRAIPEGDAYRLDGRWQWASNSPNAAWIGGGSAILEDGKPRMLPNGMLDSRMLYFPAAEATLIDSWHVSGLCGTASGEFTVEQLRVPREFSVSLIADPPREPGPLYRFPVFGLLALGIAAVLLGTARAAIEDLVALAGGKKPQGSQRTLAERAGAQSELAHSEALLRSARAFYYEAVDDAWRRASAGDALGVEERASLRLAASHATHTCADVVSRMYKLAGGSSVFASNPLQRRFRDAHVGTQHMMVAPPIWELAGRVLMGLPTDPGVV